MHPLRVILVVFLLHSSSVAFAQPKPDERFDRTEAMVPMRDGAKLFTLLYVPKLAEEPLPIIFIRTPYGIDGRWAERNFGNYLKDLVEDGAGYAFAFQDIRGRYKSEGQFVMCRPARDANDPKAVDEASDTSDTIDWLLKSAKENNGRVGMLGISYPGRGTRAAFARGKYNDFDLTRRQDSTH